MSGEQMWGGRVVRTCAEDGRRSGCGTVRVGCVRLCMRCMFHLHELICSAATESHVTYMTAARLSGSACFAPACLVTCSGGQHDQRPVNKKSHTFGTSCWLAVLRKTVDTDSDCGCV